MSDNSKYRGTGKRWGTVLFGSVKRNTFLAKKKNSFSREIAETFEEMAEDVKQNITKFLADVQNFVKDNFAAGNGDSRTATSDSFKPMIDEGGARELDYLRAYADEAINLASEYEKLKEKYTELTAQISKNVPKERQESVLSNLEQMKSFEAEANATANVINIDIDKISDKFSGAITDMISGSKDFSSIMKSLADDLCAYFVKSITDYVSKGLMQSASGGVLSKLFSNASGFLGSLSGGKGGFFGSLAGFASKLFSHHSGGVIVPSSGYSLPGTSEYLSVLKGGERVLSPSENASYSAGSGGAATGGGATVINSFNIKAWDSKDVKSYLLDNKSLIASITAENIKNNNSNLRQLINGV